MSEQDPQPAPENPTQEQDPIPSPSATGAEHQLLGRFTGTWKAYMTFWPEPGADPIVSQGTMKNGWTLGKRFLAQRFEASFLDTPFKGMGFFGYNTVDQRYEGFWVDTMSTAMTQETGTFDERLQAFTMNGTVTNPMDGSEMRKKTIITFDSNVQHTMTMYFGVPGTDDWVKTMQIIYRCEE